MVPVVSIACSRLILSLRGMVFSQNAVGAGGFGMSESWSHDHSDFVQGSGTYRLRPPTTKYVHSSRNLYPIDGARQGLPLNADRSTTVVTFTDDWRARISTSS